MSISVSEFLRKAKYFKALQKAEIPVEINAGHRWNQGREVYHFNPSFTKIMGLTDIAKVCECLNAPLINSQTVRENSFSSNFFNNIKPSVLPVNKNHTTLVNSNVKYAPLDVFNGILGLSVCYIINSPSESLVGERTYRQIAGQTVVKNGDINMTEPAAFIISDQHPAYNYLDKGNIIVFYAGENDEDNRILVLNQLGLDTSYIIAAFTVNPDLVLSHAVNGVFINGRDARLTLLKIEKGLTEKYQPEYRQLHDRIFADFETNAQSLVVTKFQRQEVKEVTINEIKFSNTKAQYDEISIEADDLASVVLANLDTNAEFDIYTIIDIYIDRVLKTIQGSRKTGTGFSAARDFNFKINNIPIVIRIETTHTRRRVNGLLINADEVQRVVRRASCFQEEAQFNAFVKQVHSLSLECHDVLSNGLPVKVHIFGGTDYGKPATNAHPKLKFVRKGTKVELYVNKEKTLSVPISRFIGFIREVNKLNRETNGYGYYGDQPPRPTPTNDTPLPTVVTTYGTRQPTDDRIIRAKDASYCRWQLKLLVNKFITEAKGTPLTEAQLTTFIDDLLAERTSAELKSVQLLSSVVKSTGAEEIVFNGMEGYRVKGKLRNYFVDKSSNKVHNADTGAYICIVDGRGEMGVGYDALVARLLALKNDSVSVRNIGTLR